MKIKFVLSLVFIASSSLCAMSVFHKLGGNFKGPAHELRSKISPDALHWMDSSLSGLDSNKLVDIHTHLVGSGRDGKGAWINPQLLSWAHPKKHAQFLTYLSAGGMQDLDHADQQYFTRMEDLVQNSPIRGGIYLFAFDGSYSRDGVLNREKSEFIIPNTLVYSKKSSLFQPVISINPYRKDALSELEYWAQKGVKMMKWLPNSMGIDPADSSLIPFYQKMHEHQTTLITHAGAEQAVDAKDDQKLGNPLRLRLPLSLGVRVILAHCASSGTDEDLDQSSKPLVQSSLLFARMMAEPKYQGLLYGDLSATTQVNRYQEILPLLFAHPEWFPRLINGSDYPLPAINVLFSTSSLVRAGYITAQEADYLKEIYAYNPLLFDLLLKLSLRDPKTGLKLPKEVFYRPSFLDS